jgi:hypothetical protein
MGSVRVDCDSNFRAMKKLEK